MMTRTSNCCAILAALALSLPAAASTVSPWTQWKTGDGGNGHWYRYRTSSSFRWTQANTEALRSGPKTHLATITSAAENAFLREFVPDGAFFIGGLQTLAGVEPGGGWRWVTGEDFSYANWSPGEPNNSGGREEYLHFNGRNGLWNDIPDGVFGGGYLLESEVSVVPIPAAAPLFGSGLALLVLAVRRRRKVVSITSEAPDD